MVYPRKLVKFIAFFADYLLYPPHVLAARSRLRSPVAQPRDSLRHGRHRRPQWRVLGQHAEVAMPVRARWRHQLGNMVDQLQWGEHQFTRILVGLHGPCVALATAVNQISAALLEASQGKGLARAVA